MWTFFVLTHLEIRPTLLLSSNTTLCIFDHHGNVWQLDRCHWQKDMSIIGWILEELLSSLNLKIAHRCLLTILTYIKDKLNYVVRSVAYTAMTIQAKSYFYSKYEIDIFYKSIVLYLPLLDYNTHPVNPHI